MIYTIIQLNPLHRESAWWLRHQPGETPSVPTRGTLDDAIANAAGTPIILLAPSEEILLTHAELKLPRAKLRKALPYALEEQIAEDVETLHFAIGGQHDGKTDVAVVRSQRMRDWLEVFSEHGVSPRAILPDVLALPWQENEWFIATDQERALVRTGQSSGFACHPDHLSALLEALVEAEDQPEPNSVHVWHCDGSAKPVLPAATPNLQQHRCDSHILSLLAQGAQPRQGLNLLQGDYSQQTELSRSLKPWRWAAALLGIWFVLGVVYLNVQKNQLNAQKVALNQQAETIYRNTFPDAKRVVNPRVQMEQKLRALRGGSPTNHNQFLDLLASTGTVLNTEKDLVLERISYRGDQLTLKVTAKSLGQLDALQDTLKDKAGLKAELRDADSGPNKASGQIRIER